MSEDPRESAGSWGTSRRAAAWANLAVQSALLLAILVVVTLLAAKTRTRFDLTSKRTFTMSVETRDLLKRLDYDVRIWLNPDLAGAAEDKSLRVAWDRTRLLLEEFGKRSERITYKTLNALDRDSLAAIQEHWGTISPYTLYILATPSGQANKKAIDLYQIFRGDAATGRVKSYRGEGIVRQTIRQLGGRVRRIFYEVEGHSEVLTADVRSLGQIGGFLTRNEGVELRRLKTAGARIVPGDCDVLIIMGPSQPFVESELQVLRDYLARGGRMLVALRARVKTGLEEFLEEYGVRVGDNIVHELRDFFPNSRRNLVVRDFSVHAVNRGMVNVNFPIPHCCSLTPVNKGPGWKITPLARSSADSWTETGPVGGRARPAPGGKDEEPGPHALIIAVEKPAAHEHGEKTDKKQPRLLVWGSFIPFTNTVLASGGRRLQYIANNFRWLAEEDLLEIEEETIEVRPLDMSQAAIDKLYWGVLVGFPAFGVILGLVQWFLRRK